MITRRSVGDAGRAKRAWHRVGEEGHLPRLTREVGQSHTRGVAAGHYGRVSFKHCIALGIRRWLIFRNLQQPAIGAWAGWLAMRLKLPLVVVPHTRSSKSMTLPCRISERCRDTATCPASMMTSQATTAVHTYLSIPCITTGIYKMMQPGFTTRPLLKNIVGFTTTADGNPNDKTLLQTPSSISTVHKVR